MSEINRPNLFIVGAPKTGTSAMYQWLGDHPYIYMSPAKEPHYFATDLNSFRACSTEASYQHLFAKANAHHRWVGEASKMYMFSEVAIEKLKSYSPDARLIVMLRNPVELVYSFHHHLLFLRHETVEDFERAWNLQEARLRGEKLPRGIEGARRLQYKEVGMIGARLKRVLHLFGDRHVCIIFFENFKEDPRKAYQKVLAFLGLNDHGLKDFSPVNRSKTNRVPWLTEFLRKKPWPVSFLYNTMRRFTGLRGFGIGNRILEMQTKKQKRNALSSPFKEKLRNVFEKDIELLEHLTSRNLDHWR